MSWSPQAVVVTAVREHLPAAYSTAKVGTKVPSPRPPLFVKVSRVGGEDQHGVTDLARFLIECWARETPTQSAEYRSEVFANAVCDTIRPLTGKWAFGVFIRHAKPITRPVDFPDESNDSRFQFTAEFRLKPPS